MPLFQIKGVFFKAEEKKAYYIFIFRIIWWIISIIGLIYMYKNDMITERRIENWIFILVTILVYTFILKLFKWYSYEKEFKNNFLKKDENGKFEKYDNVDVEILERFSKEERNNEKFQVYKKKWIKKIKIALILSKTLNPIFWFWVRMNVNLIFFYRWINWKFYKHKIFRKVVFFVTMYCINNPMLIVWWFYYRTIAKWKYLQLYEIIFRRVAGWLTTIIWITVLGDEFYYFYRGKEIFIIMFIYIILIIIGINWKKIQKRKWNFEITIKNLIEMRIRATGLGSIIGFSSHFSTQYEETIYDYYTYHNFYKFDKKKRFLIEQVPQTLVEMMNEIKYQPSIKCFISLSVCTIYCINNKLYYAKKFYKNEKNRKIAMQYENFYFDRLKENCFLQWDIVKYIFKDENACDQYSFNIEDNGFAWIHWKLEEKFDFYYGNDKFYEVVNINNIDNTYMDLKEKIYYFTDKIWPIDRELEYYCWGWQYEIEQRLGEEEDMTEYAKKRENIIERNKEYQQRIEEFKKEWKSKNSGINKKVIKESKEIENYLF